MNDLTKYQEFTRTTAVYPKDKALEYCLLGLGNEAGEVLGKYKKYVRGDYPITEAVDKLQEELGDVFWYLVRICDELGISAQGVLDNNRAKLEDRLNRNVLKGDGDNR